ncbi:hypothetical protein TNCV_3336011 [Trichonephila clavipes]|nr:hypothetical protein TNCV_3336011 [Trichonephila clavipes]
MPAMIRYLDHWTTAEPEIVVRDQFIYMDDSTLPHKVTVVEDLLKEAGSTVEAIIFNPDESGVKTNWKSAGGTNAGAQMLLRLLELMRLFEVRSCFCFGIALSLSLSLFSPIPEFLLRSSTMSALYGNVRYRPLNKSRANCCSVQFTMGSGISSRYHPSQNPFKDVRVGAVSNEIPCPHHNASASNA